jgi:hypothetical protein
MARVIPPQTHTITRTHTWVQAIETELQRPLFAWLVRMNIVKDAVTNMATIVHHTDAENFRVLLGILCVVNDLLMLEQGKTVFVPTAVHIKCGDGTSPHPPLPEHVKAGVCVRAFARRLTRLYKRSAVAVETRRECAERVDRVGGAAAAAAAAKCDLLPLETLVLLKIPVPTDPTVARMHAALISAVSSVLKNMAGRRIQAARAATWRGFIPVQTPKL